MIIWYLILIVTVGGGMSSGKHVMIKEIPMVSERMCQEARTILLKDPVVWAGQTQKAYCIKGWIDYTND